MNPKERAEYIARYGDQSNVIRISRKYSDLIGIGTEYLVIEATVVAKLHDGNIVSAAPTGNKEITLVTG